MVDIRNVTSKPTVTCSFRPGSTPGEVSYWVEVKARDRKLDSDRRTFDCGAWPPELLAKLSTLDAAYDSALSVRTKLWAARLPDPTVEMQRMYPKFVGYSSNDLLRARVVADQQFSATFEPARAKTAQLDGELMSLYALMAGPSFMDWLSTQAIVLKVERDDTDERSYALYRCSVWSCSRALEPEQWQLLVERVLRRGEAELAAALAEEAGTSQGRERLSPEVRRAVWTRDQGKCARCGNRERLEFDHIVPVSRGGSNTERNVELLCEVCNRAKSDSIM